MIEVERTEKTGIDLSAEAPNAPCKPYSGAKVDFPSDDPDLETEPCL